jgi:hypothetical protein
MTQNALASARLPADMPEAIGKFIVNFNAFEAALYLAFCTMIKDDGRATEAILSGIDSLSYKIKTSYALAELLISDNAAAEAILANRTKIERFVSFRNELAHGIYMVDENGEASITHNLFRMRGGKPDPKPIKTEQILAESASILEVITSLSSAANGTMANLKGVSVRAPS